MKNKHLWLVTIFSLVACVLYASILFTPFGSYLYSSAFKVLLFVSCPLIYYRFILKEKFTSYLFVKGDSRNIRFSIILGVCVFLIIWGAYFLLRPLIDHQLILEALDANGITGSNIHFAVIYIVLINAALEQVFFRGFVFMTLYRMDFKGYAHVYSSLLFALYHVPIIWGGVSAGIMLLSVLGLVAAGLIFNYLAVKCRNLVGSIIVHVSANLALNTIALYNLHLLSHL